MKMKIKIKEIICLILLSAMLLCTVSCMRVSAAELSAGFHGNYRGEDGVDPGIYNNYAFTLFSKSNENGENLLISPLSALACTAMLCNGAGGETLAQLEAALGCDTGSLNKTVYAALSGLVSGKDHRIGSASSMWVHEGLNVRSDYLQTNADYIGAQVYSAKFDDSTVKDINNWAKKKTDGMIPHLVDDLPVDSVMALLNSVLFDMKWQEKYEKDDISDGVFRNADGSAKTVPYLHSDEGVYFSDENTVGFAKYYLNSDYMFIGLLPDESIDINEYINTFTAEKWAALWSARENASVVTAMPEFDFDSETDLQAVFKSLGVTDLFDPDKADLSKISDQTLYCSVFRQKARIEHGRNGTKAAAVTFSFLCGRAAPSELVVHLDRPFVFLIADAKTGSPVFTGAVKNL